MPFPGIRLKQALQVRWRGAYDPFIEEWVVLGSVHRDVVAASNLSVGSGVVVIFFCLGSPDRVGPLSRPGTRPGIRPVIHAISWRTVSTRVVSRCLSATGVRFSVILCPPGIGPSSRSAYRPQRFGPRRGFRVPHVRAATGVGALLPRGRRCSSRPRRLTGRRLPLRSGQSLTPPHHPTAGISLNEASTRVHTFRPSGLPLACGHPDGTGRPWAFPRASHPADQEPNDARRGGNRPSSTDLELPLNSHQSISNPVVHSLRATSRRTWHRHRRLVAVGTKASMSSPSL